MSVWRKAREAVNNLASSLGDSTIDPEADCDLGPILEAIRYGEQAQHQGDLLRHAAEARVAVLESALRVIHTAVRGDEKSQHHDARAWLDARGIYNGDLDGAFEYGDQVIAEVASAALAGDR